MAYTKIFAPRKVERFQPKRRAGSTQRQGRAGDQRDGSVYVYSDDIVLAVNVALATARPLLIRGASGSGKSSLAANIARKMRWRYYESVISSRTQARDLLWTFDTVRRLSDSRAELQDMSTYIKPGVLWWAFDSASARLHGGAKDGSPSNNAGDRDDQPAVVLLDEIDKADPDLPNNLLVPLGSLEFTVTETDTPVKSRLAQPPLLCITTNEERDLPPAVVRRCVSIRLEDPNKDLLVRIAKAHFGADATGTYSAIADQILGLAAPEPVGGIRPSAAEYLDAVQASLDLDVAPDPDSPTWRGILEAITGTRDRPGTR